QPAQPAPRPQPAAKPAPVAQPVAAPAPAMPIVQAPFPVFQPAAVPSRPALQPVAARIRMTQAPVAQPVAAQPSAPVAVQEAVSRNVAPKPVLWEQAYSNPFATP